MALTRDVAHFLPSSASSVATFSASALAAASLLHGSKNLQDFVWTESERPSVAYNDFECELPLIDMAALLTNERDECLFQMAQACKEWGILQVVNHGVPSDLICKMDSYARSFFKLSLNQKRRVLRGVTSGQPLGYTCGGEGTYLKNDFPWMEALQLSANHAELDHYIQKIWLKGNHEFSCLANEYIMAMKGLSFQLLELLTTQLGLKKEHISKHLEEGNNSVFRFNYYQPCPQPSLTLGLGAHSDPHVLTILHQDEVGGLQIVRDKKWIGVRPHPNALIVNVGDVLQVWSNDVYKSVEHRAVCNSIKPRLSMAFFLNPGEGTEVAPAQELITTDQPLHYRAFTWREYRESMYAVRLRGKSNLLRFQSTTEY